MNDAGNQQRQQPRTTAYRSGGCPLAAARRAFTLMELFSVAAIVLPLLGIMAPVMLGKAREDASRNRGAENLRQIILANDTYAASYQDRIASFSWRAPRDGRQPQFPGSDFDFIRDGMQRAAHDGEAAALQAGDIIARRTRHAPGPHDPDWLPHELYTTLILQDFLASRMPEPLIIHPADRRRLLWQQNQGRDFLDHALGEDQPDPKGKNWHVLYSSSFITVTAMYDARQGDAAEPRSRLRQGRTHREFVLSSGARLGGLRLSDVRFPTSKVWMHDDADWVAKAGPLHHTHPDATINHAFADGSVRSYPASEINPGWDPWRPDASEPTLYDYAPRAWEGAGGPAAPRPGLARWTRAGIGGIDVHGREVDTGQQDRAQGSTPWVRHADRDASREAAEAQANWIEHADAASLRR